MSHSKQLKKDPDTKRQPTQKMGNQAGISKQQLTEEDRAKEILQESLKAALRNGTINDSAAKEIECYPLIIQAAALGKETALNYLLLSKIWEPNVQIADGSTAIIIAVQKKHTHIVNFLLNSGADPTICRQDGMNALMVAVASDDSKTFSLLWHFAKENQYIINHADLMGRTLLLIAVENGSLEFVKFFSNVEGVDLNWQRNDGLSPLMLAAINGHSLIVEKLISVGSDIFLEDENGATALCLAISHKQRQTVDTFYSEISAEMKGCYVKTRVELLNEPRRSSSNVVLFYRNILVPVIMDIKSNMREGLYLLRCCRVFVCLVKCAHGVYAKDVIDIICHLVVVLLYSKVGYGKPVIPECVDDFVEADGPFLMMEILSNRHLDCSDSLRDVAFLAIQTVCETESGRVWLKNNYSYIHAYMNVFESRLTDLNCWFEGVETKAHVVFDRLKRTMHYILQQHQEVASEFIHKWDCENQEKFPFRERHDRYFSHDPSLISHRSMYKEFAADLNDSREVPSSSTPVKGPMLTSSGSPSSSCEYIKLLSRAQFRQPVLMASVKAAECPLLRPQRAPYSSGLIGYADAVKKNLSHSNEHGHKDERDNCVSDFCFQDGKERRLRMPASRNRFSGMIQNRQSSIKSEPTCKTLTNLSCRGKENKIHLTLVEHDQLKRDEKAMPCSNKETLRLEVSNGQDCEKQGKPEKPGVGRELLCSESESSAPTGVLSEVCNHHSDHESVSEKCEDPGVAAENDKAGTKEISSVDLVHSQSTAVEKHEQDQLKEDVATKVKNLSEVFDMLWNDKGPCLGDSISSNSKDFEKQMKFVLLLFEKLHLSFTYADVIAFAIRQFLLLSAEPKNSVIYCRRKSKRAVQNVKVQKGNLESAPEAPLECPKHVKSVRKSASEPLCVLNNRKGKTARGINALRSKSFAYCCKIKKSHRLVYTIAKKQRSFFCMSRENLKSAKALRKCLQFCFRNLVSSRRGKSVSCQTLENSAKACNAVDPVQIHFPTSQSLENISSQSKALDSEPFSLSTVTDSIKDSLCDQYFDSNQAFLGDTSCGSDPNQSQQLPSAFVNKSGHDVQESKSSTEAVKNNPAPSTLAMFNSCFIKLEKNSQWYFYLCCLISFPKSVLVVPCGMGSLLFSTAPEHSVSKGCFNMHVGIFHHGLPTVIKCLPIEKTGNESVLPLLLRARESGENSKHLVEIYGIVPLPKEKCQLVLSELCEYNLSQYLLHVVSAPNPKLAVTGETFDGKLLVYQFIEAMKFLHQLHQPVLHGHLKPSNLLVTSCYTLKVSDYYHFDTCPLVYGIQIDGNSKQKAVPSQISDFCWRAPELITSKSSEGAKEIYTKFSDVHVAGMLIYYILSIGHHPYGENDAECQTNIASGCLATNERPFDIESRDLIQQMLQICPSDRPTFSAVSRHPYFWTLEKRFKFLLLVKEKLELIKRHTDVFELLWESCLEANDWVFYARKDILRLVSSRTYENNFVDLLIFAADLQKSFDSLPKNLRTVIVSPCFYVLGTYPSIFMSVYDVLRGSHVIQEELNLSMFF